jgi:1-deoxy-D-xylulose-5-phosphate reductoisomerase
MGDLLKKITILGSTGSIGQNTLKVIEANKDDFAVYALVAGQNIELLVKQAKQFKPKKVIINDVIKYAELKTLLANEDIEVQAGNNAIIEVAAEKVDIVVLAIVGMVGVNPAYAAILAGNNIAIANKESIVVAGDFLISKARETGSKIIPIDSEHNSLFQLLEGKKDKIEKLVLTASGGPFFKYTRQQLQNVTIEQALKHPNWVMGVKNTIDSATLMNKGLELIEAAKLFEFESQKIDVIIHPESIVHAMVEMKDGSFFAHLSTPDMRLPISAAICYPEIQASQVKKLKLTEIKSLNFYEPQNDVFPAINLARLALQEGGAAPLIFNVANEIAVEKFLKNELRFIDITVIVEKILSINRQYKVKKFDDIFLIEQEIRKKTIEKIDQLKFVEV